MGAPDSRPIRVMDVTVAAISLCLLLALIAPSLAESNGDARRAKCLDNIKQICLGLHSHEDARKHYPLASTAAIAAKPGSGGESGEGAGFGWLAHLVPYFDELPLYAAMRERTSKMTASPFADAAMKAGGQGPHFATASIDVLVCPAFEGARSVDVAKSDYTLDAAGRAPAITNYFALSASHMILRDDGWFIDERPESFLQGNGAIPMLSADAAKKGWQKAKGVTLAALSRDGTSNTFMFCESREQAYRLGRWASRLDGGRLAAKRPAAGAAIP